MHNRMTSQAGRSHIWSQVVLRKRMNRPTMEGTVSDFLTRTEGQSQLEEGQRTCWGCCRRPGSALCISPSERRPGRSRSGSRWDLDKRGPRKGRGSSGRSAASEIASGRALTHVFDLHLHRVHCLEAVVYFNPSHAEYISSGSAMISRQPSRAPLRDQTTGHTIDRAKIL